MLFAYFCSNGQIANWNYEPIQGTFSNPTSNSGSGTSSIVNLGGGTITPGSRTGMNPLGTGCGVQDGVTAWALEPFDPGTSNESNGAQFNCSTVGFQNITFTWDQRWSNTAANTLRAQYTIDGTTWVSFTMTTGNTTFCGGIINGNGCFESNAGDVFRRLSVNFSAITAANNNPNFGVRILASYYQSTSEFRQASAPGIVAGIAGTWRFDNVSFTGTPIPGPTASVMSGTSAICPGFSTNIRVTITGGISPYTLVYTDGTTNFTVNNYISATNISVSPASTRNYTIVSVANASNGALGTGNSGLAAITVHPLPAIPTATNLSTCISGAFTMTGGSAPPLGHTGSYSIGSPYSGGTTSFTYIVTNSVTGCSRSSASFTFTRNVAPSIITQPTPSTAQTVCINTPFAPVTVVGGGTPITYQWFRNTINSTVGAVALTGAAFVPEVANGSKSATFTPLSNVLGTYYYYVRVVSGFGTCSPISVNSIVIGPFTVIAAPVGGTASGNQTISCGVAPADLTVTGFTNTVSRWQYASDFAFTTPVDIPASASATLLSAQIGAIPATRYYRAVIENGTCTAFSTVVTLTLGATKTWDGLAWIPSAPTPTDSVIIAGDYSAGSITACSCTVNAGFVMTFTANQTLTLTNELNIDPTATVIFENNSSLVQINDSAINTGNIRYRRTTPNVIAFDYIYWSSPVAAQVLANAFPNTTWSGFYKFNNGWVLASSLETMQPGRGYIVRTPNFHPAGTPVNTEFVGIPNNGLVYSSVVIGATANNLIGNPYPSALDIHDFLLEPTNQTLLDGTVYLWAHLTPFANNVYTANDYVTYNFSGGVGLGSPTSVGGLPVTPPGRYIGAGQSFFIRGLANGSAVLNNSMREGGTNNSQFYRNASSLSNQTDLDFERNRIWLNISNDNGSNSQMLYGYIESATEGYDRGFDGEFTSVNTQLSIYTKLNDKQLSIQARDLNFSSEDIIPISYSSSTPSQMTISLSNFDGLFIDQAIYLQDNLLNIVHDLKLSNYQFYTESGNFDDRFVLRFTPTSTLQNNDFQFNDNAIIIYNENQNVMIKSMLTNIKEIEIIDLAGRVLLRKSNLQSNLESISLNGIFTDILIIKTQLNDGSIVTKKFLK